MVGKDVGHWAVPVYSGNPRVAVALLRMIWAWEWGQEGVRAVPKLLWVRAKPAGV